jgi:protein-S-isoprenylcysteine O-methyltransferase Ste14
MNKPLVNALLILAAVAVYGTLHSYLASLTVKAWVERELGETAGRWYRLFYNVVAAVTLVPVLALSALLPDQKLYVVPFPWGMLNILVQIGAVIGLVVGLLHTGALSFLGFSQLSGGRRGLGMGGLVTRGMYATMRHPLYTFGLLFLWASPSITVNHLAFNLGATGYFVVGAWLEERKLLREFGEAYDSYRKRTPMLIPFFKRVR